jgi:NTP pyrophosphatase (non-canonical NTP hydrolase)
MNGIQNKIIAWAVDRNLIEGSDPIAQKRKLEEEISEFYTEVRSHFDYPTSNLQKVKDELGDVLVVLTIIAEQLGVTFEECLSIAYEKIKDRKGRMIDGVFVKEKDLQENV